MIRVCSAAAHTPCVRNIFIDCHSITVNLPFCRQSYSVRHRKCIAFALRNQYVSTIPPDKGISGVRLRRYCNGRAEFVFSVSTDTACFGNVFVDCHSVRVAFPFCRQNQICNNDKRIIGFFRKQCFSVKPTKERIAGVCRCSQSYLRAIWIVSAPADGSCCFRVPFRNHALRFSLPKRIKPLRFACVVGRVNGIPRKGAVIVPCAEGIVLVLHRHGQVGAVFQHSGRNGLHAVRNRDFFQIGKTIYR